MTLKVLKKKNARVSPAGAVAVQNLYNQNAPLLALEALLFAVVGVFVLIKPVGFMTVLTLIVGAGLMLFGLYRVIAGFMVSQKMGGGWFDVLFGLGNLVLGVLICVYPVQSIMGMMYIFAIMLLFKGIGALLFAINLARARFGHYWINIVVSLILIGLSVGLLFFPLAGATAMAWVLAMSLFVYAISDVYMFWELLRLKRYIND